MPMPVVLGHEGAGIVEKVGPGVTRSKPGDHVILNIRANCGHCHHCIVGRPVLCDGIDTPRVVMYDGTVRLHRNGQDVHHMARTACFAEYTRQLQKIFIGESVQPDIHALSWPMWHVVQVHHL